MMFGMTPSTQCCAGMNIIREIQRWTKAELPRARKLFFPRPVPLDCLSLFMWLGLATTSHTFLWGGLLSCHLYFTVYLIWLYLIVQLWTGVTDMSEGLKPCGCDRSASVSSSICHTLFLTYRSANVTPTNLLALLHCLLSTLQTVLVVGSINSWDNATLNCYKEYNRGCDGPLCLKVSRF